MGGHEGQHAIQAFDKEATGRFPSRKPSITEPWQTTAANIFNSVCNAMRPNARVELRREAH